MNARLASIPASSVIAIFIVAGCGGAPSTATTSPGPTATLQPTATVTATATATPTVAPSATQDQVATTPPAAGGSEPEMARIATGETPTGWVEVLSTTGVCRIAVPSDWDTEILPSTGAKLLEAQASAFDNEFATWDEFKTNMKFVYFGADKAVLVDTDEMLVMRAGPSMADYSWFVAVNQGTHACGTVSIVTGNSIATYRETSHQILYSVAAK